MRKVLGDNVIPMVLAALMHHVVHTLPQKDGGYIVDVLHRGHGTRDEVRRHVAEDVEDGHEGVRRARLARVRRSCRRKRCGNGGDEY